MMSRKEPRPEVGSLEAALRELNAAVPPDEPISQHPEDPAKLRPGEHSLASPRSFDAAEHGGHPVDPDREQGESVTLWGRCGYVPASRVRER